MANLINQVQLYRFLKLCDESSLEKSVLDCGAGGANPPLQIFLKNGYKTYGIELCDSQIDSARAFCKKHEIELNISKGDMQKLPFDNEAISHVYSYNSIFHMKKSDIQIAMSEIKRVLKHGGMCCVNFLSLDDEWCGDGKKLGENEYLQIERGEEVIHSYFATKEAEQFFDGMKILYKENRIIEREYEGRIIRQGYIDYIAQRK
jgi:ubiquinone/menaquinone biosynthesis C-methylase UbiE